MDQHFENIISNSWKLPNKQGCKKICRGRIIQKQTTLHAPILTTTHRQGSQNHVKACVNILSILMHFQTTQTPRSRAKLSPSYFDPLANDLIIS